MNLSRRTVLNGLKKPGWIRIGDMPCALPCHTGDRGGLEYIEIHYQQECHIWFNVVEQTWKIVSRYGMAAPAPSPTWQQEYFAHE